MRLQRFDARHLDGAAGLLAERHERHRGAEPLLARADARAALAAVLDDGATGAAALRGRALIAYVLGTPHHAPPFGRSAWVTRAGHAAADPEALRDAYAAAAEAWVEQGARRHFALVPALAADMEPWYGLGFARMHAFAGRESGWGEEAPAAGVRIRPGGHADVDPVAVPVDALIAEVQARAPSFANVPPAGAEDWHETLDEPGATYFVAERDGAAVGHALLYPAARDLGVPADAIYLASTAVMPGARRSGVGLALTAHALDWARGAGYGSVVTSWRVTNLLASRFWPARGFRPTFERLVRAIGAG